MNGSRVHRCLHRRDQSRRVPVLDWIVEHPYPCFWILLIVANEIAPEGPWWQSELSGTLMLLAGIQLGRADR